MIEAVCYAYPTLEEYTMLSIRLDPETERRLSELAKRTGRTKSYYARELTEGNIDHLEDHYIAEARLERRSLALTSNNYGKHLAWTIECDHGVVGCSSCRRSSRFSQ